METPKAASIHIQPKSTEVEDDSVIDKVVPFDGGVIHYRLEGSTDPAGPVLVFSNALTTNMSIWDPAVASLKQLFPTFRFLRYDTRGYTLESVGNTKPIDLDVLSADIANLMTMLEIPRARAVIGVGLGGATTLAFASRYPDRLEQFIACDCRAASDAKEQGLWDHRIFLANRWPDKCVLADKAVSRWFLVDQRGSPLWQRVHKIIAATSIEGLSATMGALCHYDERERLKSVRAPGLFVAGSDDSVLPEEMCTFPEMMADGLAEFKVIPRTGFLPMLEDPAAWIHAVKPFLERPDV